MVRRMVTSATFKQSSKRTPDLRKRDPENRLYARGPRLRLDAERALRHVVIDRKISGGTDSETGSRFVERMPSAAATCRRQDIDVLAYLTRCDQARLEGRPCPSLLPAAPNAQAA